MTLRVLERLAALDLLHERQLRHQVDEGLDDRGDRLPPRLALVVGDHVGPGVERQEQLGQPRRLARRAPEATAQPGQGEECRRVAEHLVGTITVSPARSPWSNQSRSPALRREMLGYDAYAQKIAMAREIGTDGIVSAFMEAAVWGPSDRILRKLEERRAIVGEFELATSFRFGGARRPGRIRASSLRQGGHAGGALLDEGRLGAP